MPRGRAEPPASLSSRAASGASHNDADFKRLRAMLLEFRGCCKVMGMPGGYSAMRSMIIDDDSADVDYHFDFTACKVWRVAATPWPRRTMITADY